MRFLVWVVACLGLMGCEVKDGQMYANAGENCYQSGATAIDEDSGHELVCKRDSEGNLTWLVK